MIYTNTIFDGFWPVGSAAVVVADSQKEAAAFLETALEDRHLGQTINPDDMKPLDISEGVTILCDGDY